MGELRDELFECNERLANDDLDGAITTEDVEVV
jgi:hypothetical protein